MHGQRCLFCGGDRSEPDHDRHCDGRQGAREALAFTTPADAPDFDGETYDRAKDHERLGAQALRVWSLILDGQWRTLAEIESATGDPQASVSARLRDFRKSKFGSYPIERRRRETAAGLWEYRLVLGHEQKAAS